MVTIKAQILFITEPGVDLGVVYTGKGKTLDDARVDIQNQLDKLFPDADRVILRRIPNEDEDEEGKKTIWMP